MLRWILEMKRRPDACTPELHTYCICTLGFVDLFTNFTNMQYNASMQLLWQTSMNSLVFALSQAPSKKAAGVKLERSFGQMTA